MLKIRLQRVGRKHDPSFRVVLTDVRQGPKSGKFIETLGFYDTVRKVRKIKTERVKYWITRGAQVSETVHNILVSEKIITGQKINVLPQKTPIKKEEKKILTEEKEKIVEDIGRAETPSIDVSKKEEVKVEKQEEIKEVEKTE